LCIVPPDEVWDTLQRARHVARDDSFTIWPPAIRLFHPLPDGLLDPLKVASVVERYRIEPFEVRLNQWAVIPHAEVLAAQLEAVRASRADSDPDADDSAPAARLGSEDDETRRAHFDALIRQEERLGRINKERRDLRALERGREQRREAEAKRSDETGVPWGMKEEEDDNEGTGIMAVDDSGGPSSSDAVGPEEPPSALSPREVLEKQQRMYEEFNGPCVVCLEPDADSKARLVELRELLRQELFGNCTEFVDRYSPTATVAGPSSQSVYRRSNPISSSSSSTGAKRRRDRPSPAAAAATADAYRPLVPIGAFATVNEAIRMARKLRQLWNPLSFTVTDLQVVSMKGAEGEDWFSSPSSSSSSSSAASPSGTTDRSFAANPPQMGCDAMIMLVGQEVPFNDEESQEMTRLLCERGEPGGAARQASYGEGDESPASRARRKLGTESSYGNDYSNNDDNGNDGQYDDLLQFLDEDDVDEGTVVVIGRTHFFTGEMRHYVGMPATSTSEHQAAIPTTGSSGDTGASRRKSSVTLSRLLEGEFGQVPLSDGDDDDDGNDEVGA
jgi:hypothetical protein